MIYGILIIAISWIFLASRFYRNRLGIDPWFLRLYALGALIIFLDSFSFRHFGLGLLPAASMMVGLAIRVGILIPQPLISSGRSSS